MRKMWLLVVGVLMLGTLSLTGCNRPVTAESLRKNLTPEMAGIANTHEMRANMYARTKNTNKRTLVDDWDSLWLMDRPSQSSWYVIP